MRLDLFVSEKFGISRNQASEQIRRMAVSVNGTLISKPAFVVKEGDEVVLLGELFVGRGALKLLRFLEKSELLVAGKNALDVGASTGGFTQVLLQKGALSVTALDVGTSQLSPLLRDDLRVKVVEKCDVREFANAFLTNSNLPLFLPEKPFDLVVADVSFISVLQILPSLDALFSGDVVVLFKPQFEVGKEAKRNANGVVKDQKATLVAMRRFEREAGVLGWILREKRECELLGKSGNLEFFYRFSKEK